jgi:hypothetical protein
LARTRVGSLKASGTLAALWLFGSVAIVAQPATPPPLPPSLVEPTPQGARIHEMDPVIRGSQIEHAFEVKNTSATDLALSDLRIPCGCATVTFPPSIAAGKSGAVTVKVDTTTMLGPVKVAFSLADGSAERMNFVLSTLVFPVVKASPGYARMQYVVGEPEGKIKQRVWADDFPDLQVLAVRSPHSFLPVSFRELSVEEKPAGSKGREWEVIVGIGKGAEPGPLQGFLEIDTNHAIDRVVRLPVSGFVRPVIAITPPIARIAEAVSSREGKSIQLDVRNFATEEIAVTGVTGMRPGSLQGKVKELTPGRRYALEITLPKGLPVGPFSGEVRVTTNSPKVPEILVPIEATIAE